MSETTPLLTTHQQEQRLEWKVVVAILSGTVAEFVAAAGKFRFSSCLDEAKSLTQIRQYHHVYPLNNNLQRIRLPYIDIMARSWLFDWRSCNSAIDWKIE